MSDLFSKNCWYAIGGSTALEAGGVSPARLFGEERVVWRGEDGASHVWQNQCIHRGMRLQYGFVDQNRLSCRYHGWRFGGDGKCANIPAHPDMTPPDDFCVPAYPSAENNGLIWTTTGKPDDSPPDLSGCENLTFCRSIVIDTNPAEVDKAVSALASSSRVAPGVTAVETSADETIIIAIQPVDGEKTQLHVLTAAADTTAARRRASAWARQFRWQVENVVSAETASQNAA